ncbi:hypothetical protein F7725_024091 [Dissostichus mawsoni]|uniref:Uncharacterized protein n=1 Tax=Dissostichus mawsoni TaxID=36200 RepID=A0A7J5XYH6_DISMA|nr:hypothetical protein F7725_024091 [Dissostichus mawsoni]
MALLMETFCVVKQGQQFREEQRKTSTRHPHRTQRGRKLGGGAWLISVVPCPWAQWVLCAVGVETLHQGEFNSLGIYLLVSSLGIMMFELAYFLDTLLVMCLPCPPDWQLFVLWGKMAHVGGFHKFLYYSIMSVVCFLHPVLENKAQTSKEATGKSQRPRPDHCLCGRNCSFEQHRLILPRGDRKEKGGTGSGNQRPLPRPGERGESVQAMLELEQTAAPKGTDRERRWWKEGRLISLRGREEPVEREMEEMDGYCEPEPDSTSDTAPMITD